MTLPSFSSKDIPFVDVAGQQRTSIVVDERRRRAKAPPGVGISPIQRGK
jgi:hypothetical protein